MSVNMSLNTQIGNRKDLISKGVVTIQTIAYVSVIYWLLHLNLRAAFFACLIGLGAGVSLCILSDLI